ISSGNLQEMFELKMKSLLERGVCEDEDDMRLQICVDFINKIRQRNKEDQQYQNKYLPTIGIELEFLFIHDPDYPELNFNASDYYYRTNRLKPLDPPYKPIQEVNGAIEYAIGPSASHLTQLREILHLAKIGLHPSNFFSPHITIGGLDLSPDHQEPLYIQSLVFGCGFSEFKQADLNLRREKGKFKIKLRERYKKITETPDGIQYVPFLKKRSAEYTKPYGQKQTEQDEDSLRSVEFRLGNRFKSFQNLTREVDAIYYLSTAAIAHQKDASERDPVEVKLSQIWEELAHKLDEIYLQIGIHFPSGATKSFIFGSSDSEEVKAKRGSTPYNTHLFELGYQSATDAVFRSQIRTLVKNARKEILDCINCR
ncbi:MAG TPA: hypothetical protein PKJ26_05460, partial [Candidatus Woesebacteria bacterium]|nr:hypothetical protein [Candidatus Woesebacteria bacterium]